MNNYFEMVKLKETEATKNRKDVLYAIVEMSSTEPWMKEYLEGKSGSLGNKIPSYAISNNYESGVSSIQITDYLNKRNQKLKTREIDHINLKYENGEMNGKEIEKEIEKISAKYAYNLRTVQRSLQFLIKKDFIIRKDNKYHLSAKFIDNLKNWSFPFRSSSLYSLMKNHTPLYNTLEKNIDNLITLFGSYVFYCLLESGRPLNDKYFSKIDCKPMTAEEKKEFTEKWLEDSIDVSLMYKYFLETFLNQPDDGKVENLRQVKHTGYTETKDNGPMQYVYEDSNENMYCDIKHVGSNDIEYVKEDGKQYIPNFKSFIEIPKIENPLLLDPFSIINPNEIPYELCKKIHKKIHKKLSEKSPQIYERLTMNMNMNIGQKNHEAREFYLKLKK